MFVLCHLATPQTPSHLTPDNGGLSTSMFILYKIICMLQSIYIKNNLASKVYEVYCVNVLQLYTVYNLKNGFCFVFAFSFTYVTICFL